MTNAFSVGKAWNRGGVSVKGLGKCIRKYRERAGITQEELAEKVNISTNHLGAIEREVKTPTLDTFVKILNGIGAEPNEALKEVVPMVWKEDISILEERLSELTPTQREKVIHIMNLIIEEFTT